MSQQPLGKKRASSLLSETANFLPPSVSLSLQQHQMNKTSTFLTAARQSHDFTNAESYYKMVQTSKDKTFSSPYTNAQQQLSQTQTDFFFSNRKKSYVKPMHFKGQTLDILNYHRRCNSQFSLRRKSQQEEIEIAQRKLAMTSTTLLSAKQPHNQIKIKQTASYQMEKARQALQLRLKDIRSEEQEAQDEYRQLSSRLKVQPSYLKVSKDKDLPKCEAYEQFRQRFRETSKAKPIEEPADERQLEKEADEMRQLLTRYHILIKTKQWTVQHLMETDFHNLPQDAQFFIVMYLKFDIPFFQLFDRITINSICKCLKMVSFKKQEMIFMQGEEAQCMYIVLSGQVGIYTDEACEELMVTLKGKAILGERALQQTNQRRSKTAKALQATKCLQLDKDDFYNKISYFQHVQKQRRIGFLYKLPFTQQWSVEKIKHFNTSVSEVQLSSDEVLFDIGSSALCFYIVKSGRLAMEARIQLEGSNQHPQGKNKWEVCTKKRTVMFEVEQLGAGEICGQQELIDYIPKLADVPHPTQASQGLEENRELKKQNSISKGGRKCRVRAIEPSVLIYVDINEINTFFRHSELMELATQGFVYDEVKTALKVKQIIQAQKFVNKTLKTSTLSNYMPSTAVNSYTRQTISVAKVRKQQSWIDKATEELFLPDVTKDEKGQIQTKDQSGIVLAARITQPKVKGIEKIKILETRVSWQNVEKRLNGEVVVRDVLPLSQRKRETKVKELVQETEQFLIQENSQEEESQEPQASPKEDLIE